MTSISRTDFARAVRYARKALPRKGKAAREFHVDTLAFAMRSFGMVPADLHTLDSLKS